MDWKNKIDRIINKIKNQIHAQNIDSLCGVRKLLIESDVNNNGSLDRIEFQKLLSRLGIFLTTQEFRIFFEIFDLNHDGKVQYQEFINTITTDMSQTRLDAICRVFSQLDQDNSGKVSLVYLEQCFQESQHPRVLTRQKPPQQVRNEFFSVLKQKSHDGQNLTSDEFIQAYQDIHSTIPIELEQYFIDMVTHTWKWCHSKDYVSDERLQNLELIVFEKIRQKTKEGDDEGKTLYKVFQYFDIQGHGVVTLKQFDEALVQFGCIFTQPETIALFSKFDPHRQGKIAYDEFCSMIALLGSGSNVNVQPVFKLQRQPPVQILNLISKTLAFKYSSQAIEKLQAIFENSDKNKNGTLDRSEFTWALVECGVKCSKTEFENIFRYFDKNCDNQIDYNEFINGLLGELTKPRKMLLFKAFKHLDSQGEGKVSLDTLFSKFHPSQHCDVFKKKYSEKQIMDSFKRYWSRQQKEECPLNVTLDSFEQYYKQISLAIQGDKQFDDHLARVWDLPH